VNQRKSAPQLAVGVVFDGDDTLWATEQLYDDARLKARLIVADAGLDAAAWEAIERRIDVEKVATLGHSARRFPASCVQAYGEVCRSAGVTPDRLVAERVRRASQSVFACDPPLVPGAREILTTLRARGARLALLTKGDRRVQRRRIERSGLGALFDIKRIVAEKSPETIRQVVASLGISVESAWMVGNSIRSDVLPALSAGLRAIWIRAHVWEYERACDHLVDERVIPLSHLSQIAAAIEI
jgi:putative hydrolase of the HAD superfamily